LVAILPDINSAIAEREAQLAKTGALKQGMMQQLPTGGFGCSNPSVNTNPQENCMQVQRQLLEVTTRKVVIELPESFVNHRVELIALTEDDENSSAPKRRRPHPDIAGKGRTLGELVEPLVDEGDWKCLK